MNAAGIRPLLYPVQPWSDESILSSFQLRLRAENRIGTWTVLAYLLQLPGRSLTPTQFLIEPQIVARLGELAGLDFDLATFSPRPWEGGGGHSLRWRRGFLNLPFWMHYRAQVCPLCLREKGYLDFDVDYWHIPVCLEHAVCFVDFCDQCNQPLELDRASLMHCDTCGRDLRNIPTPTVDIEMCARVGALLSLEDLELTALRGNTTLSANQIASLVTFFATGEAPGMEGNQLPIQIARAPAGVRLRGLARFLQCVDGNRIAAPSLLKQLVGMAFYLTPFAETPLLAWWLRNYLQPIQLGLSAINAIAFDDPSEISHMAIRRLAENFPRAKSREDVWKYLEISEYELDQIAQSLQLQHPSAGMGYDADQLLHAAEFLKVCFPAEFLDGMFGIDGLTHALESHSLLQRFAPRCEGAARYTPDSVLSLLGRLHAKTPAASDSQPNEERAIRLGVIGTVVDVTVALVHVLNDARAISRWPYPHKVADLVVAANGLA